MRRSSRIQIKQETTVAGPKSEQSKPNRLTTRKSNLPAKTIKVLSPKRKVGQKNSPQASTVALPPNLRKPLKSSKKPKNKNGSGNRMKTSIQSNLVSIPDSSKPKTTGENPQKPNTEKPQEKSNEKASFSGKTVKNESIPLLIQEDSNDSILSDVANSLKIDRTIKNLSPRKFFHNKDPKTTRSGRSFSPYDFASYSALFGSICANPAKKPKPESEAGVNLIKREKHEGTQPNKPNKHKKAVRRDKRERLRTAKKSKKPIKKHTKRVATPVEFEEISEEASEVSSSPVVIKEESLPTEKPYQVHFSDLTKEIEDDIFSEKVPASFWLDFPFPRFPFVDDSLPVDFWESYCEGSIPVCNWEVDCTWCEPNKIDLCDVADLSKVCWGDVDKYEFKSVFKDVSLQMTNFEDLCGEWKPSPAYGKFDVMEAESAESRRFYRKRITDTRLIEWHKYNLASSTRYCSEASLPKRRPVIKVRFSQCPKADLLWRLTQQPPPSIDDIFNDPVVLHSDPQHAMTE